jgi:asparagine synthase (glutamine-hydrolysing)
LPKHAISYAAACEELRRLLEESVRLRMISDVPLGAFLSGGIDSSAVVAMMSRISGNPINTFSVGFPEAKYNELPFARRVANHLGTNHHEIIVHPDNVGEALDRLVYHYNEPFADPAALPTYCMSKFARRHVNVALNGDGGDENFAGYERYSMTLLAGWAALAPAPLRRLASAALDHLTFDQTGRFSRRLRMLCDTVANGWRNAAIHMLAQFPAERLAPLLTADFARSLTGPSYEQLALGVLAAADSDDPIDASLYADINLYLPDALIVKVDIASMAVGLEARSPMLDQELVEFAARLPREFKSTGRKRKLILKDVIRDLLPPDTIDRPKTTFAVPLDYWFRGSMGEMLRDTLLSKRALERSYFVKPAIERLIDDHLSGAGNWKNQLWTLLMLELWHRRFIDRGSADCNPRGEVSTERVESHAPISEVEYARTD